MPHDILISCVGQEINCRYNNIMTKQIGKVIDWTFTVGKWLVGEVTCIHTDKKMIALAWRPFTMEGLVPCQHRHLWVLEVLCWRSAQHTHSKHTRKKKERRQWATSNSFESFHEEFVPYVNPYLYYVLSLPFDYSPCPSMTCSNAAIGQPSSVYGLTNNSIQKLEIERSRFWIAEPPVKNNLCVDGYGFCGFWYSTVRIWYGYWCSNKTWSVSKILEFSRVWESVFGIWCWDSGYGFGGRTSVQNPRGYKKGKMDPETSTRKCSTFRFSLMWV